MCECGYPIITPTVCRRFGIAAAAALLAGTALLLSARQVHASEAEFIEGVDLSRFRLSAGQHDGRFKTLDTLARLQQVKSDLEAVSAQLNGFDPETMSATERETWSNQMDRIDLAIARARNALLSGLVQAFDAEVTGIQAVTGKLAVDLQRLNLIAQVIETVAAVLGVVEHCARHYDFLERFCGVRFYGPKADSVVFPVRRTLEIQPETIRREPVIQHVFWKSDLQLADHAGPKRNAFGGRVGTVFAAAAVGRHAVVDQPYAAQISRPFPALPLSRLLCQQQQAVLFVGGSGEARRPGRARLF